MSLSTSHSESDNEIDPTFDLPPILDPNYLKLLEILGTDHDFLNTIELPEIFQLDELARDEDFEDDPEESKEKPDTEEFRNDRTVTISNIEVAELGCEPQLLKKIDIENFTMRHASRIRNLLRKHFQFLVQGLQTTLKSEKIEENQISAKIWTLLNDLKLHKDITNQYKTLLRNRSLDLTKIPESSELKISSEFKLDPIQTEGPLCAFDLPEVDLLDNFHNFIQNEEFKQINSSDVLPIFKNYFNESLTKKTPHLAFPKFTPVEDKLFTLGLTKFGPNLPKIIKHCLPTKTEEELRRRRRNVARNKDKENPVRKWFENADKKARLHPLEDFEYPESKKAKLDEINAALVENIRTRNSPTKNQPIISNQIENKEKINEPENNKIEEPQEIQVNIEVQPNLNEISTQIENINHPELITKDDNIQFSIPNSNQNKLPQVDQINIVTDVLAGSIDQTENRPNIQQIQNSMTNNTPNLPPEMILDGSSFLGFENSNSGFEKEVLISEMSRDEIEKSKTQHLLFYGQPITWTKEEDKVLLTAAKNFSPTPVTWDSLITTNSIEGKTIDQISERYQQLLSFWQTQNSNNGLFDT